ncbi:hypothetical protein, partial [Mesorhizobium sp. M7A.F.Ca.CA.002.04.1.1]|uniref:hypothetical protein n=1 Tax=Mesorhizobium sp. M7A.F.Ca.CA.002.04.1.1 TaxID=2496681 RepID=UPI0019D4C1EA
HWRRMGDPKDMRFDPHRTWRGARQPSYLNLQMKSRDFEGDLTVKFQRLLAARPDMPKDG